MMLFIEEVLQVLAIEVVGVGCVAAVMYGYWKYMVTEQMSVYYAITEDSMETVSLGDDENYREGV